MRYQDKHGNEITEGMYLRFEDGSVEQVYACQTGDESDLGINASNEAYLQAHGLGEFPRNYIRFPSLTCRKWRFASRRWNCDSLA